MVRGQSRKQRKELLEEYFDKHPNATLKEISILLGVSVSRAHRLLLFLGLRTRKQTNLYRITDYEKEILRLMAKGNNNREIAKVFGVSERTVKNRITIIQAKLNANDKAHTVTLAIEQGYI